MGKVRSIMAQWTKEFPPRYLIRRAIISCLSREGGVVTIKHLDLARCDIYEAVARIMGVGAGLTMLPAVNDAQDRQWRYTVGFAKKDLVEAGILKDDCARGEWQLVHKSRWPTGSEVLLQANDDRHEHDVAVSWRNQTPSNNELCERYVRNGMNRVGAELTAFRENQVHPLVAP